MAKVTTQFREAALRNGMLLKSTRAAEAPANVRFAAAIELANLGFVVNPADLEGVGVTALTETIAAARKVMGADRAMEPIYPGFPKQVQELSTMQLFVEQILHYWSGGVLLPNHPKEVRPGLPLEDMLRHAREVKVLAAGAAARGVVKSLALAPIALSEADRELMVGAMELAHPSLDEVTEIARAAKHGENMQHFLKTYHTVVGGSGNELILAALPAAGNLDQVLRSVLALASVPAADKWEANYKLAVETLSNSNARAVRMEKLSRPARRAILARVGDLSKDFNADSLVRRQDLWRGVMRAVHGYDFKLTDGQKRALDIIHENGEYRTLNSLVEEGMANRDVVYVVELLMAHNPGELLRRLVALLRLVKTKKDASVLAAAVAVAGSKASLSTLISSYNGVLAANEEGARVTRVAGQTNTMVERTAVKVKDSHRDLVAEGISVAIKTKLREKAAPAGPIGTVSAEAMPLVRRDAATGDRVMDRGQALAPVGEGDVLRFYGHWNNNQNAGGYMDIGVVLLDDTMKHLAVCTWNGWGNTRDFATYSGDKYVTPGDSAAEFIDVDLKKIKKVYPQATRLAMTVQSWSGWPTKDVDFVAGAMFRSAPDSGEVFDARTVVSCFKPTTESTQSIPYVFDLKTGMMIWLDSSSGATGSHNSATDDSTVGSIVYDELLRPRLTMGELATWYAEVHGVEATADTVDKDLLMGLLA